jgi:3',5'-cyclic AMP phosphodiesterase CpdA
MPSAGNHENELGNGPIGYQAYQTYFAVPEAVGQTDVTRGLWYAFTAGSVRVISIANDDVAYQDGGNSYVRGYSSGAQRAWLENELSAARRDHGVDWVVVCMHQVAISTADMFMARTLGSGRNGCRYSTDTASISWCAGTSTITSARTRSGAGNRTPL